eukprot:SAG31_NODE_1740_length_7394_cov_7.518849_4_plen_389_part_00
MAARLAELTPLIDELSLAVDSLAAGPEFSRGDSYFWWQTGDRCPPILKTESEAIVADVEWARVVVEQYSQLLESLHARTTSPVVNLHNDPSIVTVMHVWHYQPSTGNVFAAMRLADQPGSGYDITTALEAVRDLPLGNAQAAMRLADQPGSGYDITTALEAVRGLPSGSAQAAMRLADQPGSGYDITTALEAVRGLPAGNAQAAMRLADQPGSGFDITTALDAVRGLPAGSAQAAMRLADQPGSGFDITQALVAVRDLPPGNAQAAMQIVEDRGGDVRLEDVLHEQRDSHSQRSSPKGPLQQRAPRGRDRKPRAKPWSKSDIVLFLEYVRDNGPHWAPCSRNVTFEVGERDKDALKNKWSYLRRSMLSDDQSKLPSEEQAKLLLEQTM